jgi:hypothetical protein
MSPRPNPVPNPRQAGGKSRKRPDQDAWQRLAAMKPMDGDRHE